MLHAVVGDVDILMHAVLDQPAQHQAQRALRYRTGSRGQRLVGQVYAGHVIIHRPAVQQVPFLAVRVQGPAADQARIVEIQPALARIGDRAVGLGDKHGAALVDRYLLRAYLDFERHA